MLMGVLLLADWGTGYRAAQQNWGWIKLAKVRLSSYASQSLDISEIKFKDETDRQRLIAVDSYLSGDCAASSDLLEQVIESVPTDIILLYFSGHAHYQCGEIEEAIERWKRAGAAPSLAVRCVEAWDQQLFEEAFNWCSYALYSDPELAEPYQYLGQIYARQRQHLKAIEHYQRALSLDDSLRRIFFHIGSAYRALGDLETATEYLVKEIAMNPSYSGAPYVLGLVYFEQQRYAESAEYLLKAISLEAERFGTAEAYLLAVIEVTPTDPGAAYVLGLLYLNQQYLVEAEQYLQRASESTPKRSEFLMALGDLYCTQHDKETAFTYYRQAQTLSPTSDSIQNRIEAAINRCE